MKSKELEYIEALGPGNRTKAETPDRIMYLANSFSKVINNIEPGDGMDKVKEEVETYQLDDDQQMLDLNKKLGFDQYWEKVSKITEGEGEWPVYPTLSRLARSLGTAFNSGSEQERGFSRQADIHRDPKKNRMLHTRLDNHMQIKYGMETKEIVKKCQTCCNREESNRTEDADKTEEQKKKKFRCGCHCKYADISDQMVLKCNVAWKLQEKEEAFEEDDELDTPEDEANTVLEEKTKKFEKLKEEMAKRTSLTDPV